MQIFFHDITQPEKVKLLRNPEYPNSNKKGSPLRTTLLFFPLSTNLVADRARRLAGRLARSLAFAAIAVIRLMQVSFFDGFYMFHDETSSLLGLPDF